jgi:hypothetical protein
MMEAKALGKSWWCRGGGAAVLGLLAAVLAYRDIHDPIFWIAIAFFAAHTVQAIRLYRQGRRLRTTATVIQHYRSQPVLPLGPPLLFSPAPITSVIRLDLPPK